MCPGDKVLLTALFLTSGFILLILLEFYHLMSIMRKYSEKYISIIKLIYVILIILLFFISFFTYFVLPRMSQC